ncbi:MAG TPA: NUDIX domain-containing protein [Tepidiformaceae bacterium]|nr:NUDIX domain-containing protein [Tepidiformaceae bacterium]
MTTVCPISASGSVPGGGLEPGETHEHALAREIREETGIAQFDLGPCAWLREHTWWWPPTDEWITSVEHYYVVHTPTGDVETSGQDEAERQFVAGYRWFTLEELRTHPDRLVPADFAERAATILAGELPTEPIRVGD